MSTVDDVIRERLRKLRCDDQATCSSVTSQTNQDVLKQAKKSSSEMVEDLMRKLSAETVLEDTYGKDKTEIDAQIRRRLDRLKEWELGPPRASFKEIGRLKSVPDVVNAVLSQKDLRPSQSMDCEDPSSSKLSLEDDETSSNDSDSPPDYCVFCKSEPSIVCIDCYKDSYCTRCFNEFHEPEDEHQTFKYQVRRKKKGGSL